VVEAKEEEQQVEWRALMQRRATDISNNICDEKAPRQSEEQRKTWLKE
jgi:hypothetical protein